MNKLKRIVNWRPEPDGIWALVSEFAKERGGFYLVIASGVLFLCIPLHRWWTLGTVLLSLVVVAAYALVDYGNLHLARQELKNRREEAEMSDEIIERQAALIRRISTYMSQLRAHLERVASRDDRPEGTDS